MSFIYTIVLLALSVLLLTAFSSNILFWYENLNNPDERLPAPRPGFIACPRFFLESFLSFVLCAALVPFGALFRRAPATPHAGEKPELPPLILVHGLYNNAGAWAWLGRRLEREGYRVSTFVYGLRSADPEAVAANLDEHVRSVESLAAGKKPIFICHSLGGLIVRRWLMEEGRPARAGGLITLGTPHNGSKVAWFGFGRQAVALRPGSDFLRLLREAPPLPPLPCVSLVSPTDGAVLPSASLLPPEGWEMRVTGAKAHFSMLFSPAIADMVSDELKGMAASAST